MNMNVLVTGGAGYIGSHTVVELIDAGFNPVVLDNFSNSTPSMLARIERITHKKIPFYELDVRNTKELIELIKNEKINYVIHFAAFKAVGESVSDPIKYYDNNLAGLVSVLDAMEQTKVSNIVFSSSCTVYGDPDKVPVTEEEELRDTTNPYGETKQISERILSDVSKALDVKVVSLRYFNPIGAHPSSLIGELPIGKPNCLVPYLAQATDGKIPPLTVYGDDYDTPDGTCIRDYIHVVDLAKAHVSAINFLAKNHEENPSIFNIGTGNGTSVLEVIKGFEKVNNVKVPYKIGPRRPGDVPIIFASTDKAKEQLGWTAKLSINDALKDTWNWQKTL